MKHTFTGNFVLQINDEKIPLTSIGCNEILTYAEPELIFVKGDDAELTKLWSHSGMFDCLILECDDLVVKMVHACGSNCCYHNNKMSEIGLLCHYKEYGNTPISFEMSNIGQKNKKTCYETAPDYSECYD